MKRRVVSAGLLILSLHMSPLAQAESMLGAVQDFWTVLGQASDSASPADRLAVVQQALERRFGFADFYTKALVDHWADWSEIQKAEFDARFRQRLTAQLASRLDRLLAHRDRKMAYHIKKNGSEYAISATAAVGGEGMTIISFIRASREGWKIVDIEVEGALLSRNYRGQFNNILRRFGYAELLRRLEPKGEARKLSERIFLNSNQGGRV